MRIGIDARFITRPPRRGIGSYSLNLVCELVQQAPEVEYALYIDHPDVDGLLPTASNVRVRRLGPSFYPLWEQVSLPRAAKQDRVDLLHCLGNTGPIFVPKGMRSVLSLMDVMFLQSGEFVPKPTNSYQRLGRMYRGAVSPRCARNADAVLTISEFSRNDILDLIPGLDSSRVFVTHLACDRRFSPPETARRSGEPFILCLGADDPRKNTLRMVRAYLSLVASQKIDASLVISGYANWEQSEAYAAVKQAGATERVRFMSFVSSDELVRLYQDATIFVYPSLYEGFGIPVLEAFNSGCPVIASNVTSIPEVAGDAALYVDPRSQDDIERAVLRLLRDEPLRRTLAERGCIRAQAFNWSQTARKTLDTYRACLATTPLPR